ncbi:MAG: M28 family metallopeptidase [Defluviitaleaceae bacterium]|nr:M28 family metallopeptidase [Defluviitaleaceae bacterium]MCL2264141.1 M28 family metallopeptidase [Defluviitaleaceae bacterium]
MDLPMFASKLFIDHPTRMWRKEKDAFLTTCCGEFLLMGYDESEITIHNNRNRFGFDSRNLLVGKADADILITAHYDTPGRNGFLARLVMPSFLEKTKGQVILFAIVITISLVIQFATDFIVPLEYRVVVAAIAAIVLLFVIGSALVKNKHNHNDNTSGVLGVMQLASLLVTVPDLRNKCAFILFDHEEVMPGLLGSKAFEQWRKNTYPNKPVQVINLDCIGNGDVLTIETKKPHDTFHNMVEFLKNEGYIVSTKRSMGSDHESFETAFSLCFQKRSRFGFLYIPKIHTGKDTICDLKKIEDLCSSVYNFLHTTEKTVN